MEDIVIKFGRRVRQLRMLHSMTQEELAEAANLNITFIGDIERGKKSATLPTINKLAAALNITLSELFRFDGEIVASDPREVELQTLLRELEDRIKKIYMDK